MLEWGQKEIDCFSNDPDAQGHVEDVVYRNEETGYGVITLIDDSTFELVTATGSLSSIFSGEYVYLWGKWVNHKEYGKQLEVIGYKKKLPMELDSMLRFLSSKAIKGLGPKTAAKIVARFGIQTFDVIEYHPEWLTDIQGISPKNAAHIHECFMEQGALRDLDLLCNGALPPLVIQRVLEEWGPDAKGFIQKDPYRLCREISGISFQMADAVALSNGIAKDSFERIRGGIRFVLLHNGVSNGHTCMPTQMVIDATATMLGLDISKVSEYLTVGIKNHDYEEYHQDGASFIFTKEFSDDEKFIAEKLLLLQKQREPISQKNFEFMIEEMQSSWGIEYAIDQLKAIQMAVNSGVMVLTGGPGTGKTTVIRALVSLFKFLGYSVALAAPTGRAAKRMSEATINEAKTIHRLLEVQMIEKTNSLKFMRNEDNVLDESIVIVDEVSMMDLPLMASLLKALRHGSRIILIGDSNQLPSVGPGNVLADLIQSGCIPKIELTQIFRQNEDSIIVTNAHLIKNGQMPVLDNSSNDFFYMKRQDEENIAKTVVDLITNRLPKAYGKEILSNLQVISPTRKGKCGTVALNNLLQSVLNPKSDTKKEHSYGDVVFRVGDQVMANKNEYMVEWEKGTHHGMGIFNGDMGEVINLDDDQEVMTISFEGRICDFPYAKLDEIEHSYAITVHKSQGSEYDTVIMPLGWAGPMLQTRNLLYTCVTRAKEKIILIGREEVLSQMVRNTKEEKRFTGLKTRIQKYFKENE